MSHRHGAFDGTPMIKWGRHDVLATMITAWRSRTAADAADRANIRMAKTCERTGRKDQDIQDPRQHGEACVLGLYEKRITLHDRMFPCCLDEEWEKGVVQRLVRFKKKLRAQQTSLPLVVKFSNMTEMMTHSIALP